ncbi:Gucy1b2 [Symbiodinium microadriaticum]|nr:Gucy1b2 [Symbiodinium sp. KB8]CAE7334795.1 Gucy1b2 [Symbiodinium microadriaticum]
MNHDPVLSVEVDRASILFVMFVDFDQTARKCCRLRFWVEALAVCSDFRNMVCDRNHYFTKFDDICSAHEVTKIETVGEEYVSAVGVIPRDIEADKALGHAVILGRLIKAAKEILMVQRDTQGSDEEVKLKMGIHTGPVVAGVIGQKLPRFRLFGDTINTAARLMQKGLPGELQFGEATKSCLPKGVAYRWRDNIEMKGKGKVSVESLWVEACFPDTSKRFLRLVHLCLGYFRISAIEQILTLAKTLHFKV